MHGDTCPCCPGDSIRLQWTTFGDGSRHIRRFCARCKRFLRWELQTPETMTVAEPEPETKQESDLFDGLEP